MQFFVNSDLINTFINPILQSSLTYKYYYDWRIDWWHKGGGIKKSFYYGSEGCPIESFNFERNLKLMGAGKINFAYINFLIHSDDVIKIYYKNALRYQGIVDGIPDPKGEEAISLISRAQRLDEVIINLSYANDPLETMLQDIFEEVSSITGITYNSALVDLGNTDLYAMDFTYVTAKKAIDTIVNRCDDRYWGVDQNDNFWVYQLDSSLTGIIANGENQWYSSIKRKYNDNKIKMTRSQNFKKGATSGQQERTGQTGYDLAGGSYPTLAIEQLKRRIDGTFSLSEAGLSDAFVNDLAYAKLQKDTALEDTVTINDVRIDKIDKDIGSYLKVIDEYEIQMIPFLNDSFLPITDSVDDWTNVTSYTDDYIAGTGALQMLGSNPTDSAAYYDFGRILRFKKIDNINFMIKSIEVTGNVLEFSVSETIGTLFDTVYQIYINNQDVWEEKEIPIAETSFRYMGIRMNYTRDVQRYINSFGVNIWNEFGFPALFVTFIICDFRWFGYGRQEYKGNLVQEKIKVDKKKEQVTWVLNAYNPGANDDYFYLNEEVEKLKDVQKA